MSNQRVQCYNCKHACDENELIYKEQDGIKNETCPKCGGNVFYELRQIENKDGEQKTATFATRV